MQWALAVTSLRLLKPRRATCRHNAWVGEYRGGEQTPKISSPKDLQLQSDPKVLPDPVWGRRGSVFCYRMVVSRASQGLFRKEDPTQNVLRTSVNRLPTEVWLGISRMSRGVEVSEPHNSGKALSFLGVRNKGEKYCYRTPARARILKERYPRGMLVYI